MAKQNRITVEDLVGAVERELTIYGRDVTAGIDKLSEAAVKDLVKRTRATAPEGNRGNFKRSIASGVVKKSSRGTTYAWYVKPPDHRLTHLLVHGHAKRKGGRTKADPFLQNALREVLKKYEADVEEAIKNGN